ncbi:MAG TPA: sigma-70 family RNA polymerase sigma factor [Solirubrobacteraceae bacterium]|nr:sigma-70 family RNA polymerase sigma factor [Solirubrobacteraceae bacterium]
MTEQEWLAERFEEQRPHLRAVAYRLLGSHSEADDALQDAWLRASRHGAGGIENPGGWFTTIVARVALNMLRARKAKREEPLEGRLPDPIISPDDPEHEALLADSVGLALLVVLETLAPAERIAFVMHDVFAVSFDEIAGITGRSPAAARQLASRARRRVRDQAPVPDADLGRQRRVVDAFTAAAREGDIEALVAVLDPDVVLRTDGGTDESFVVRGARAVAGRAASFAHLSPYARPVLVNGGVGALVEPADGLFAVLAFTVSEGRIVELDVLSDPVRLAELDLSGLDG